MYGFEFNKNLVRLGVAIHDAGKILHPDEIFGIGNAHELSGEKLLLETGVQANIARCSLSHARYELMETSFEELLVALSDKLWKGKRVDALELQVIDHIVKSLGKSRWDIFHDLDDCFEKIAARAMKD